MGWMTAVLVVAAIVAAGAYYMIDKWTKKR
jgi:hypothetical protein